MKSLKESYENTLLGTKYGDKGSVHSYIELYEQYVSKFKSEVTLLELGVGYGESMLMWEDYFDAGTVIGVQLPNPNTKFLNIVETHNLNVIYSDATNPNLASTLSELQFDIIIDDASHKFLDQKKSFFNLKHLVKPGGFYFIEDIENIDTTRKEFESFHNSCIVHDMRKNKNRFDDVLIVYQF